MATTVIKQLVATIRSGQNVVWHMTGLPPYPDVPLEDRQPAWIINWQAVPIFFSPDKPAGANAVPAIKVDFVAILEEADTSQMHAVSVTCFDAASTGVGFLATYVLYAVFFDVP